MCKTDKIVWMSRVNVVFSSGSDRIDAANRLGLGVVDAWEWVDDAVGPGLRDATGVLAGCVRVGRDTSTSYHFENTADGALFVDP